MKVVAKTIEKHRLVITLTPKEAAELLEYLAERPYDRGIESKLYTQLDSALVVIE